MFIYRLRWFIGLMLCLLVVACSSPRREIVPILPTELPSPLTFTPTPRDQPTPVPTLTDPIPTSIPATATPAFTIGNSLKTLDYYPLEPGNTWVYSATFVGYRIENRVALPLTSTFIITDEVLAVETHSPYFAAQINRIAVLTGGVVPDAARPSNWTYAINPASQTEGVAAPSSRVYWYVIAGARIYYQDTLDLSTSVHYYDTLDLSTHPGANLKAMTYYYLPLSAHRCWWPTGNEENCNKAFTQGDWPLVYYVSNDTPQKPDILKNTAIECYTIATYTRGGGVNKLFCNDIGLAGLDYEYHGQTLSLYLPVWYKMELISYSIAKH